MRRRTALLVATAAFLVAALAAGTVVVAGAMSPKPTGEALVAPAAQDGPVGRLAVAGPWVRRMDPADRGEAQGFGAGRFGGSLVTVPDVANATRITGEAGVASFRGSVAWYRTTLTAPSTGTFALRFESVHHIATVWLDGRLLGTHTGAYLPFEYTLRLRAGVAHRLVVRADFRSPSEQKRTGWHRTWFNYGGINREVTLRAVPSADVEDPALHTTLSGGRAVVDVSADVRNRDDVARDLPVVGSLTHAGVSTELAFGTVHVGPGEVRSVRARVTIDGPALWAPGSPNLYDLRIEVPGGGAWQQEVGLRELRRDGRDILLNGKRLRLHGASLHEDVPGRGDGLLPADMDALVGELQALGANATRAQHALSPALLERLDRAGILVWQGVGPVDAPGAWTSSTPGREQVARDRVRISVRQERLHPSVVAWNLVNELAGNGHDVTEVAYVRDMARELHREDPGRLVAVDVWGAHPPKVPGPIYEDVDAVAVTNYVGWYEGVTSGRKAIATAVTTSAEDLASSFPGKVLIVSEFGAEANPENATDRPGGYGFQAWLLARHIAAYRAQPALSGMLVWDLRDFGVSPGFAGGSITSELPGIHVERGLNTKGLFDYAGRPKPAVGAVRDAFAPLGTGLG